MTAAMRIAPNPIKNAPETCSISIKIKAITLVRKCAITVLKLMNQNPEPQRHQSRVTKHHEIHALFPQSLWP